MPRQKANVWCLRVADAQVVELDAVVATFEPASRQAFFDWVLSLPEVRTAMSMRIEAAGKLRLAAEPVDDESERDSVFADIGYR